MPQSIDQIQAVADVYAAALFALAQERNIVSDVQNDLNELAKLVDSDAAFKAFVSSTAVDEDRRAASFEKIFRGRIRDEVLNALLVMNRHGRSGLVPELKREFEKRVQQAAGQVEVTATSAVELGPAEREQVTATASSVSGKVPLIRFEVDPSIIGGLVLQVGDMRYDNSVRGQLARARERLRERSERGLSIGITAG